MEQDEEKLDFISSAEQEFGFTDCESKADDERDKCVQVRTALRDYQADVQAMNAQVNECRQAAENNFNTAASYVSCMNSIETQFKDLVDKHFEKLTEAGFSPSS